MPPKSADEDINGNGKRRRSRVKVGDADDVEVEDDYPACQSCRKKKAKCSRQQPCKQCLKLQIDCVYDDTKQRPGMRTGAIENLNQRLSALEQMFIGQGILLQPLFEQALDQRRPRPDRGVGYGAESVAERCSQVREALIAASGKLPSAVGEEVHSGAEHQHILTTPKVATPQRDESDSRLPPWDCVLGLVEYYFNHVHPWMPILHVRQFRQQLHDSEQRCNINVIIQAIASLCLRSSDHPFVRATDTKALSLKYRQIVILQGMERCSVQNLQAMIIVTFDIIGSGSGPSAWSLVGSMARTAEQLQLSVEDGESDNLIEKDSSGLLIRRMSFLQPPQTWIESEERRRVFWNIFLMDRFCSVGTGWNNSLTSADVRRRLPCEGAIWEEGTLVRTPYFGIAERFNLSPEQVSTINGGRVAANEEEIDSLGGFAFCVEATESLNLVTTFFLRQPLDSGQVQQVQLWLMNFKELDLRLVKWRLFLPSRWGDASVVNEQGGMDPNLALAHITHNTAVIQLHQFMAYPSQWLQACPITLPSTSSAETCVTAAAEISNIARQYLFMSEGITSPQFAFCLFVAGRVLLVHSTYSKSPLHTAFHELLLSLSEIAERWTGTGIAELTSSKDSLASRFVARLNRATQAIGESNAMNGQYCLDFRQPVYNEVDQEDLCDVHHPAANFSDHQSVLTKTTSNPSLSSLSMAYPTISHDLGISHHSNIDVRPGFDQQANKDNQIQGGSDELNSFMQFQEGELDSLLGLFDQPFQQMARVSTYGGTQ